MDRTSDDAHEQHGEVVDFRLARSPFEARVIAAVLQDAGIPVYVPGGMLADEFAMSQQLMNLQSVAVRVPSSRLADAERALAAAKQRGALLDEAAPDDEAPPPP